MTRRILAIVIALVLALTGTVAILLYVNAADARALAGKEAVTILVAVDRIPAGTTGKQIRTGGLVEAVKMPATAVPEDAMSRIDKDLDKLTVTSDLAPRQLVLRGMFGESTKNTGGLAIPDGKLAVTVELEPVREVAGYIRPGSKIAIFDTYTSKAGGQSGAEGGSEAENKATRVLLPRVEVIAVGPHGTGGTTSAKAEEPEAGEKSTDAGNKVLLTVAVTQDEAERLVHASQTGALYMALLTESTDVRPGKGVDDNSLF